MWTLARRALPWIAGVVSAWLFKEGAEEADKLARLAKWGVAGFALYVGWSVYKGAR